MRLRSEGLGRVLKTAGHITFTRLELTCIVIYETKRPSLWLLGVSLLYVCPEPVLINEIVVFGGGKRDTSREGAFLAPGLNDPIPLLLMIIVIRGIW